ncbi:Mg(2+)-transport-ATPase-associated protein MgtC [Clostridiaceae bacterium JG1575]|nr:Mg(2+)-transport-ATPase-associated protein MgtC [Clostridiaceae bacterium JG1575]
MDPLQLQQIAVRLAAAIVLGGLIGIERERKGRAAGFRTHILVSVGACLFALIQVESVSAVLRINSGLPAGPRMIGADSTRLIAQVVSGIGFLGAGTIIVTRRSIKGLTTAASIWVVASLGIACGMGYYVIAGAGGLVIFLTLVLVKRIFFFPHLKKLSLQYVGQETVREAVLAYLKAHKVRILEEKYRDLVKNGAIHHAVDLEIDTRHVQSVDSFLRGINALGQFTHLLMEDLGEDSF